MAVGERLFVAVVPPHNVLDVIEGLDRPPEPGVRYTTRQQWHVTLRFLGDCDTGKATDALGGVSAEPADVVLGPQVNLLGRSVVVVPAAGLDDQAAAVAEATARIGQPPDPRPFDGHLTIARLKRRGTCRVAGQPVSARFTAAAVHLLRSELHPDGARYEVIGMQNLN